MTDSFTCIDLETTGLNPKTDKIIEIGVVKVENGAVAREWNTLVNPGRKLDRRIVELTGISDDRLTDAPPIEEALRTLLEIAGEDVLLGHSILFDYSFVKKAAVDQRLVFEKEGIDTLKIARRYLPELESRSLPYLCRHYGIPHNAHRAADDARATVQLYYKLAEQFYAQAEAEGGGIFRPKKLCYQAKRDTPATIPQKEQLYRLAERHKLILDYDVEKLTRSEASRRIDRILAEYGR